jgi:hypothetical protein
MTECPRCSLIRGKPAWRARYMRFVWVQVIYSVSAMGIAYLLQKGGQNLALVVFLGVFLLGQLAWWISLLSWLRKFGVKFFSFTEMLLQIQGVACPNCLYPICSVEDAPGIKLCPECGCSVDGVEAIDAWKKVPKIKIPHEWGSREQQ